MAKYNFYQTSFSSGEMSPKLRGRTDIKEHARGCEILENFLISPTGAAIRRPGTQFQLDLTKYFTSPYIFPFIFDGTTAYNIIVETADASSPVVFPEAGDVGASYDGTDTFSTGTGYTVQYNTGDPIRFGASNLPAALSVDKIYYVIKINSTDFQIASSEANADAGTQITAGAAGGTPSITNNIRAALVIDNTGTIVQEEANNSEFFTSTPEIINYVQSADVIFVAWGSTPKTISRLNDLFIFEDYLTDTLNKANPYDRVYKDINVNTNLKLNPSAATGSITLVAEDSSANPVPYFTISQQSSYIKWTDSAASGGPNVITVNSVKSTPSSFSAADVTTGTDNINIGTHGFYTGDEVTLTVGATALPAPLQEGIIYYIIRIDANNLKLASTLALAHAGTPIDITTTGGSSNNIIPERLVQATCAVSGTLPATAASENWQEEAWSAKNGYPNTVALAEQRLVWGGTDAQPDTLFFSRTGNLYAIDSIELFKLVNSQDFVSTDPFKVTIASNRVDPITWMKSKSSLEIGTLGTEYIVSGAGSAIAYDTVTVKPQTATGGRTTRAGILDRFTLYISRNGKEIRAFVYNDSNGSNISKNFSVLADHLAAYGGTSTSASIINKIVENGSQNICWFLNSNESLFGITMHDSSDVIAFHKHDFNGNVKDISVIPNSAGTFDEVWLIIERGSNLYLEKMGATFDGTTLTNADGAIFGDSSMVATSSNPTKNFYGFTHLNGETVGVIADGVYAGTQTVRNGRIQLTTRTSEVIVGIPNTATIYTLPLEGGQEHGASHGDIKRIDRADLQLYKTAYAKVGPSETEAEEVQLDETIFTGVNRLYFPADPDIDAQAYIYSDRTLPITVLGLSLRGVNYAQ